MRPITQEWRFYNLLVGLLSYSLIIQISLITQQKLMFREKKDSSSAIHTIQLENEAIIEGTKAGLGLLSKHFVEGESHFILGTTHPINIKIPKNYLLFQPSRSKQVLNALLFAFPQEENTLQSISPLIVLLTPCPKNKMTFYYLNRQNTLYALSNLILSYLYPFISYQSFYTWQKKCGFLIQSTIFPLEILAKHQDQNQPFNTQNTNKTETIYYYRSSKKFAYSNEWISCLDGLCEYNWIYKGIWVRTLFKEHLLLEYEKIQEKINRKLDQFVINY